MRLIFVGSLVSLLVLAACGTPPAPRVTSPTAAQPHGVYKIGDPYKIGGVWYYPAEDLSYDETGIASWYGEDFHGRYTANGEMFDINNLTAAHRTLPMPSIVQVTNLENGRTLKLRVNDRGPFARGRIIDVSRRAAQLLGFVGPGTAKVRVQILPAESIQAKLLEMRAAGQDQPIESSRPLPVAPVAEAPLPTPPGVRVARAGLEPPRAHPDQSAPEPPLGYLGPPLPERVTKLPVRATSIYVQAGAFTAAENAQRLGAKLAKLGQVRITGARVNGAALYRVQIGPLPSVSEADRMLDRVVATGVPEARIVVD
jgi:peptidoglycan lytic transglycosylase